MMASVYTTIHTRNDERVDVMFEDFPTYKCVVLRVGSQKVIIFGDLDMLEAFRDAVPVAHAEMLETTIEREREAAAGRDGGEEQDRKGDEERDARIADGRMR